MWEGAKCYNGDVLFASGEEPNIRLQGRLSDRRMVKIILQGQTQEATVKLIYLWKTF